MMGTKGNIGNGTAGLFGSINQMMIEVMHIAFGKDAASNAALIGHDKYWQSGLMKPP